MENLYQYINSRKRGREVKEPSGTSTGDELGQNSFKSEQLNLKGTGMQEDLKNDDSLMMSTESMNAMTGNHNLRCMKVIGLVNGNEAMRILIDTGSTLNLLDLNTAKRLGCLMKPIPPKAFTLADGRKVYSSYVCESFTWKMHGASFTADMYLLQLGLGAKDMVLGIQWLVTLGDIRWNFSQLKMEFTVHGHKVSLRGSLPMANSVPPNAASTGHNAYSPGGQYNNSIPSVIPQVGSRGSALDSVAHTGNANGADWQEETYQKIKSKKEMYLPQLNALYQNIASTVQQHSQHERTEKLKIVLEHILSFLQLNKLDIKLYHKEKLPLVESCIGVLVNAKCLPKPASSTLQGKLPQPPMHTSQPIQIQPSQQAMMQPFAMQSPSLSNLQQNEQSTVQQSTALHQQPQLVLRQQQAQQGPILHQQQASMLQKQILPAQQHQQQRQQQQQLTVSQQPANSGLTSNQHTMNMLQESKVPIQQQVLQNTTILLPIQGQRPPSQPAHQQMISQSQLQGEMQIRVQTSGPLLQQQNVIEQQKQLCQPQRATQEASSTSSDSMALRGNANGADWKAEIYQKIMSMKQIYLPELNDLYQRVASKMQQGNDTCASETPAMGSGRQGISCDFDWLDGSFDGLGSGWNGARISGISTSGLDRLCSSSDAKLSERLGLVEGTVREN